MAKLACLNLFYLFACFLCFVFNAFSFFFLFCILFVCFFCYSPLLSFFKFSYFLLLFFYNFCFYMRMLITLNSELNCHFQQDQTKSSALIQTYLNLLFSILTYLWLTLCFLMLCWNFAGVLQKKKITFSLIFFSLYADSF